MFASKPGHKTGFIFPLLGLCVGMKGQFACKNTLYIATDGHNSKNILGKACFIEWSGDFGDIYRQSSIFSKFTLTLYHWVEYGSKVKEKKCDNKINQVFFISTTQELSVNEIDLQAPTLVGPLEKT